MQNSKLKYTHPDLYKQLDELANAAIDISKLTKGSNKKVWWRCPRDHVWLASVKNRAAGTGCPYCSGRRVNEENCLAAMCPEIASSWHPVKNRPLTPKLVTSGSNRKVWWACEDGHEWEATVHSRRRGQGCPTCSRAEIGTRLVSAILEKRGSLMDAFPDIANEWHHELNGSLQASDVTPSSGKKVWWLCPKGHSWQAVIRDRQVAGCPHCKPKTSKREIGILLELEKYFYPIEWRKKIDGAEVDIYIESIPLGIEVDGYYWHKDRLEKDNAKYDHLARNGLNLLRVRDHKLPKAKGIGVSYSEKESGEAVAARILERLISEKLIDPTRLEKQSVDANNEASVLYRDALIHISMPLAGESLQDLFPNLCLEWDIDANLVKTPNLFSVGSSEKVWWRCNFCGHKWRAAIANRVNGSNCPACSIRIQNEKKTLRAIAKSGCLETSHSNLATEWHRTKNGTLKPSEVPPGSSQIVWWICSKGHVWSASVNDRVAGNGCPDCYNSRRGSMARRRAVKRSGSLENTNPELAKEWHPIKNKSLSPADITAGSSEKVWWLCPSGHSFTAVIRHRANGSGCGYCSGRHTTRDSSVATVNPKLAEEWDVKKNAPLSAYDVSPGSDRKAWWRCANSHSWEASPGQRKKSGCPICHQISRGEKARKAALAKSGSLLENEPSLAAQWHPTKNNGLTPADVTTQSGQKVYWLGSCGHEWPAKIANRYRGSGCPICRKSKTKRKG
ncbi:MAG: zinc-ribbon domain-containing protein [Halioglobus sp.]